MAIAASIWISVFIDGEKRTFGSFFYYRNMILDRKIGWLWRKWEGGFGVRIRGGLGMVKEREGWGWREMKITKNGK